MVDDVYFIISKHRMELNIRYLHRHKGDILRDNSDDHDCSSLRVRGQQKYGENFILKRVFLEDEDSHSTHLEDLNLVDPVLSALKFPIDHAKFLKGPVLLNGVKVLGGN